jgi:hypothetical protein
MVVDGLSANPVAANGSITRSNTMRKNPQQAPVRSTTQWPNKPPRHDAVFMVLRTLGFNMDAWGESRAVCGSCVCVA